MCLWCLKFQLIYDSEHLIPEGCMDLLPFKPLKHYWCSHCCLAVRSVFLTWNSNSSQMCWMGFKAGLCTGQSGSSLTKHTFSFPFGNHASPYLLILECWYKLKVNVFLYWLRKCSLLPKLSRCVHILFVVQCKCQCNSKYNHVSAIARIKVGNIHFFKKQIGWNFILVYDHFSILCHDGYGEV